MKYRTGFRLDWLEMALVLVSVFFSGILISSEMEDKFIYFGLTILGAGIILIKKRIKIISKV